MENEKPVGILTERDLVRRVLSQKKSLDANVSQFMSSPLITIEPDETIFAAVERMKINGIHKIAVVKDGLKGIITTSDIAKIAYEDINNVDLRKIFDEVLLRIKPSKSLASN